MKEQEDIDNLIARVLASEASRGEIDQLEDWMNASDENRLYFDRAKNLFERVEAANIDHKVDTAQAWKKLNTRISEAEAQKEAVVIPLFRRPALRIAASIGFIAILVVLINYFFGKEAAEPLLVATQQKVAAHTLPDGSKVTLNKNSEIAYVLHSNHVREVKLKGEAYFEVVHDPAQPFEVLVEGLVIKDIGTAFNVKAIPGSNLVEVQVESGEVSFYAAGGNGLNLVKGEKAVYNRLSQQFAKSIPAPSENAASYRSRLFTFKDSPLREVLRQVNEVYGSNIVLSDQRLGNCHLSVMFNQERMDTLIEIIAETLDLEVERSGDKVILKGQPCTE